MNTAAPGEALLDLIRDANTRIVIAAPYIKLSSLKRVLAAVPPTVTHFVCVTRWLPADIAAGACDIEIFDELANTTGRELRVHPHLHAKYYSDGRLSLIGSANLTAKGLGWSTPSNVELLIALDRENSGLAEWEAMLLQSSVLATKELRDQIRQQADELKRSQAVPNYPDVGDETESASTTFWTPQCPSPERLWDVYRGRGADSMVSSAYAAARADLAALSVPLGLSEAMFNAYMGGILLQMPLLVEIDKLAFSGLTDSKAHDFLAEHFQHLPEAPEPDWVWRVVKRWLVHFFPGVYLLETGQEVLVKGRQIPRPS